MHTRAWSSAVALAVLIAITALVYGNHFQNPFQFDDFHTIVNNLAIRDLNNIPQFFTDGSTFSALPANQSYRPVVTTLNAIDTNLGGQGQPVPFPFHLSIFISFILAGLAFFVMLRHILQTIATPLVATGVALFTTAWFWLHTANAETINYIIARSDSFSTMMVLIAFAIYLGWPAGRRRHLYMLPVAAGFLAKEPALMFVPLQFCYRMLLEEQRDLSSFFSNATLNMLRKLWLPILASVLLYLFYASMTPDTFSTGSLDRGHYAATQPYVMLHYFRNFFLPTEFVIDTDWKPVSSYSEPRVFIGLLFVAAMLAVAWAASRKAAWRPVAFGILWFFIALAPTSSVIPFSEVMNDHRTFFPYIGLFISMATVFANGLQYLRERQNLQLQPTAYLLAAALFLAPFAAATRQRNAVWNSSELLWKEATINAPANGRGWMNYGTALMGRGEFAGAEEAFKKAAVLAPTYAYNFINLGILYDAMGQTARADTCFQKAIALNPNVPESYSHYASMLIKNRRHAEANAVIARGLQLSPRHEGLTALQQKNGQSGSVDALAQAEASVKATPTPETYQELSLQYYNKGRFNDCIDASRQALLLKPDYDRAYNNICAAYNELKMWDSAIVAGEQGLRLNPGNELLKGNLQAARNAKAGM